LRTKLNAVFIPALGRTTLVLDWNGLIRTAAGHGMNLDHVGLECLELPRRLE
jgi:hypothetical protein